MYYRPIDSLVGKRILSIEIDGDNQWYIKIATDKGDVYIEAWGECCSESWFYHILGVDALIGHVVTDVKQVGMERPIEDDKVRQDYDILYCVNIKTDGGYADLEFRNSSNGYYGGWISVVDSIPSDTRMIPVTRDYTA